MPRYIPVLTALLVFGHIGGTSYAQVPALGAQQPIARQASASGGHIRGVVHDDVGQRLGGVSIIAMGTTLAAARTDSTGRFDLPLPPGEYVLRANREGYTSTYREPVRIQTSVALEREITLIRQTQTADALTVTPAALLLTGPDSDDHSHSETAWRLRHLTRTVLRDTAPPVNTGVTEDDDFLSPAQARGVLSESAFGGGSFLSRSDFTGQVNFITTSALSQATAGNQYDWGRGVAYAAVGAPVGIRGDWLVRGAMTAGDLSSWALVGEYDARDTETHAIHAGVSFSTQDLVAAGPTTLTPIAIGSRSVGGIYGSDRWRITNGFDIDAGARFDRYDYLATPALVSQFVGARAHLTPGTVIVGRLNNRMIAPGADEFLPPSTSGPWLPPQRTFSALVSGAPLQAERVVSYEFGLDRSLGANDSRVLSVRRFVQTTTSQVTTLFGLDQRSAVGHYYVATPGDVDVAGWSVGLSGRLAGPVSGRVDYAFARGDWTSEEVSRVVRWLAPSTVRRGDETVQDVTTSLFATIPRTSTQLAVTYRLDSAFSGSSRSSRLPGLEGRFNLEVRQELPYQPLKGGHLEVTFAARNLLRDAAAGGSIYDELLTVSPPLRLLGGVQVRF